tara:strand:+ start:68 stop:388 length:321 start_codon:yes stop_codon:yes gene_type:complete
MSKHSDPFEEIKKEYSIDDLRKIVDNGCVSGAATKHQYFAETVNFYDSYEGDIISYLKENIGEEELITMFSDNGALLTPYKNDVVWQFIELYAMDILDEIDDPKDA